LGAVATGWAGGFANDPIPSQAPYLMLEREAGEHALEWSTVQCRVTALRFTPESRTVSISRVRVVFTSGQVQEWGGYVWPLGPGRSTGWAYLQRQPDGQEQCVDRIEILGKSLGGPTRLRVNSL